METKEKTKKESLIEHLGKIAQAVKGKKSLKIPEKAKCNFKAIEEFTGCNEVQVVFLSVIFCLNIKCSPDIDDLATYLNCNPLEILNLMDEFEHLEKMKLIRREYRRSKSKEKMITDLRFYIPEIVFYSMQQNKKIEPKKNTNLSLMETLEAIKELINDRYEENIVFDEMLNEIKGLLEANNDKNLFKIINQEEFIDNELLLFLYICYETIFEKDEIELEDACDKLFVDFNTRYNIKRALIKEKSKLITDGWLRFENGLFRSDRTITLTDKSLNLLLGEDVELAQKTKDPYFNYILPTDVVVKNMYYSTQEEKQINFLHETLNVEKFADVQKRLNDNNMKKGFTIIFYGSPGTGKTETAYQLGRSTGREIMMMDISNTKSMWFGESEKIIKKIFNIYRKKAENNPICPILLINEADAILGKRNDSGRSSIDQTQNTIQNIILQELEDFCGILIATTNLTNNLDNAFERRFLYKICFSKPSKEAKQNIWKDKLTWLSDQHAAELADIYALSGGQIDNILRKSLTNQILYGNYPDIAELHEYCLSESMEKQKNKIGF